MRLKLLEGVERKGEKDGEDTGVLMESLCKEERRRTMKEQWPL